MARQITIPVGFPRSCWAHAVCAVGWTRLGPVLPALHSEETPMRMLATAVLLAFPALLSAQENLNVIKAEPDGVPPRKMLQTYLQGEAQKLFNARRQTIAALK